MCRDLVAHARPGLYADLDGALYAIASMGGLRQGECVGLLWRAVDFGAERVRVEENASARSGRPRKSRQRPEFLMQAPQELAEGFEVARAQQSAPVAFDLTDDLARCFLRPGTALGETNQLGAPVGGIGDALDVTQALKVVDEVDDRGFAHLRELGELGDTGASIRDVLSDGPVSRAEVREAALDQRFAHELVERQRRVTQHRSEVAGAGPLPAGAGALGES